MGGFDDINKCIHDGETIIKDSEDAYGHFSKKTNKDIVAGLTDIVDIVKTVEAGMSDCSHIVADWKKLTEMVAIFSSPESFAYHVGKDLLVNGVDIFHEIEGAVTDYKSKTGSISVRTSERLPPRSSSELNLRPNLTVRLSSFTEERILYLIFVDGFKK